MASAGRSWVRPRPGGLHPGLGCGRSPALVCRAEGQSRQMGLKCDLPSLLPPHLLSFLPSFFFLPVFSVLLGVDFLSSSSTIRPPEMPLGPACLSSLHTDGNTRTHAGSLTPMHTCTHSHTLQGAGTCAHRPCVHSHAHAQGSPWTTHRHACAHTHTACCVHTWHVRCSVPCARLPSPPPPGVHSGPGIRLRSR